MRKRLLQLVGALLLTSMSVGIVMVFANPANRYLLLGPPTIEDHSGPFGIRRGMTVLEVEELLDDAGFARFDLRVAPTDECEGVAAEDGNLGFYFDDTWRSGSACLAFVDGRLAGGSIGFGVLVF